MHNEILDANHVDVENWDSQTRVKVSDAIIEVNDNVRKVQYGRYILLGIAGVNILISSLSLLTMEEVPPNILYTTLVVTAIVVVPYLIFGALYQKSPLLFLVLGLIFYLFAVALSVWLGQGLFDGYALKVGVISAFGFAIFSVFRWKKNMDKLRDLGYSSSTLTKARKGLKPLPRLRKKKA